MMNIIVSRFSSPFAMPKLVMDLPSFPSPDLNTIHFGIPSCPMMPGTVECLVPMDQMELHVG